MEYKIEKISNLYGSTYYELFVLEKHWLTRKSIWVKVNHQTYHEFPTYSFESVKDCEDYVKKQLWTRELVKVGKLP